MTNTQAKQEARRLVKNALENCLDNGMDNTKTTRHQAQREAFYAAPVLVDNPNDAALVMNTLVGLYSHLATLDQAGELD
jgi:hypothetical protein